MNASSHPRSATRARSVARKLAMQAVYQSLLNEQPWQDLHQQFVAGEEMARADRDYFRELIEQADGRRAQLEELIGLCTDRPVTGLDPIERAILVLGAYEMHARPDVPFRVVINEGVELARRFGAADGHKFVNAVLDCLAARLRPHEREPASA